MSLKGQAVHLADQGYAVTPVYVEIDPADGKKILKYPLHPDREVASWKEDASADPAIVDEMPWDYATHVGINCDASGIVVIDLDNFVDDEQSPPEEIEGEDLFQRYLDEVAPDEDHGDAAPALYSQSGKGIHIFYQRDKRVGSNQGSLATWVDVRAEGGFLIAGDPEGLPPVTDLPEVPQWIADASPPAEHDLAKAPRRAPTYERGNAGTKWGLRALEGETESLREAWNSGTKLNQRGMDEGFNWWLNACSFAVGNVVAGGELDEDHAYQVLRDTLSELGAPADQYKTLDSGFYKGLDFPRSPEGGVDEEDERELWNQFLDVEGMINFPPPEWLLPGWLERDSIARMVGQPGSGKTFVSMDMAACVSRGMSWPERKDMSYKPELVAYIVAEGVSGVGIRLKAWMVRHGLPGDMRFFPDALQVGGREPKAQRRWRTFLKLMGDKKPGLIIFDTQARVTSGVDENRSDEMGEIVDRLEELRKATGACVLLVHHTNKFGESGRGSSAVLGAINTEIMIKGYVGGRLSVEMIKQKNGKEAEGIMMRLEDVPNTESCTPRLLGTKREAQELERFTEQEAAKIEATEAKKKEIEIIMTSDTARQAWRWDDILMNTRSSRATLEPIMKLLIGENKIEATKMSEPGQPWQYVWVAPPEGP